VSARRCRRAQGGATYLEVLIAALLLAIVLVPAIEALHTGILGTTINTEASNRHYAAVARTEEVLAEPYTLLLAAAGTAGNYKTPTSYSDASGTPDRLLVYIGRYDADDEDNDGNPFTVPDPDADGDGDPYTNYDGLLWVRTEVEDSITTLETLVGP
jgi:hypothetical protein